MSEAPYPGLPGWLKALLALLLGLLVLAGLLWAGGHSPLMHHP